MYYEGAEGNQSVAVLEMMNFRKELALKVEKCLGKTEIPLPGPRFSVGVSCSQVSVGSFASLDY